MARALLSKPIELKKDWWMEGLGSDTDALVQDRPLRRTRSRVPVLNQVPSFSHDLLKDLPEIVSVKEAAKALGAGRNTIYDLMKAGSIKEQPVAGKKMIRRTDLIAYLDEEQRRVEHGRKRRAG